MLRTSSFFGSRISQLVEQIRRLSLQEWQSKDLLKKFGCTVQQFVLAETKDEANDKLKKTFAGPGTEYVVKAQVLAGGRGKGHFIGGTKNIGGVFVTKDMPAALDAVHEMVGKRLVTNQTREEGVQVDRVMIAKGIEIKRETYLAVLMDREHNGPMIVASPMGGMDIESVAKDHPSEIFQTPVDIESGLSSEQAKQIARDLKFTGNLVDLAAKEIEQLYKLFIGVDATQVEINPFAETTDGLAYCVDAKLNFDDSAAFRQKDIFALENKAEMDPKEAEAKDHNLNYIPLSGNIGCLVNGAGLAMATMDLIKLHGGMPANFLDIGGTAQEHEVTAALGIITKDPQVRAILINIFAGIVNCATVANGLVNAFKQANLSVPLVVRLEGTNVDAARKILKESKLPIIPAANFEEAAQKAVECVKA